MLRSGMHVSVIHVRHLDTSNNVATHYMNLSVHYINLSEMFKVILPIPYYFHIRITKGDYLYPILNVPDYKHLLSDLLMFQ